MKNEKKMKKSVKIAYCHKAKAISNRFELLLVSNNTVAKELAEFIGLNYPNFSRIRSDARRGVLPSFVFLLGISNYYKENFFEYLLDFYE